MAALFLYRKLAKEPVEEHVLMAGPEVGATADEMKVCWLTHMGCDHVPTHKNIVQDVPGSLNDCQS